MKLTPVSRLTAKPLCTPRVGLCSLSLSRPHLSGGFMPKPTAPCSAPAGTHHANLAGPRCAKPFPGARPLPPPMRHSEHTSATSMLLSLPRRCPVSTSACRCTTTNPSARCLPMSLLPPLRQRASFLATPSMSCPRQAPRDKCLCPAHSSHCVLAITSATAAPSMRTGQAACQQQLEDKP
jgi:hypothetical protein